MVTQALVAAKFNYGLGKAARALGVPCGLFRPTGTTTSPLSNQVGTLNALFRNMKGPFVTPAGYGQPAFFGLFDATLVLAGDYISEPTMGTFFVASMDPINYPLCVRCNTTVTLTRITTPTPGAGYYGGDVLPETVLGTGWPASALRGTKGERSDINLPGDTRSNWDIVLLPPSFPGQIINSDVVTTLDTTPLRYTVSAAEQTTLGWRLTTALAVP